MITVSLNAGADTWFSYNELVPSKSWHVPHERDDILMPAEGWLIIGAHSWWAKEAMN